MINFHPSNQGGQSPRITVIGVGGAGGNAVNNMIQSHLEGVEFIVANTDAQSLAQSRTDRRIQLGEQVTQGLGAGARPEIGRAAAEETLDEIIAQLAGSNMVFITAGMGGGTGTGAAPVIAQAARDHGVLTVGVVTRPFHFEGQHRMRLADAGIEELSHYVDTLIIIPNQNLFRVASEKTTFADAFKMADDVIYSGVRGVTDLMIMPGLINLDFADIRTVMSEMGKAMMGTGEAAGDKRALDAAEAAINNPLLEDISMKGARGVLINITGGMDMTLFEVDEAANRIRDEVDPDANIIFGSTFDDTLDGRMRVSVVATGIDAAQALSRPPVISLVEPKRAPVAPPPRSLRDSLADQGIGSPPGFAQTEEASDPDSVLVLSQESEVGRVEGETLSAPPVPEPRVVAALAPASSVRRDAPVQGTLRIDVPTARADQRPGESMIEGAAMAAAISPRNASEPPAPAATAEPSRRAGLFGRWSHAAKPAATTPQRTEPKAPMAAQRSDTARVSPAERSKHSEEDLLDIPAFLRRQAN